MPLNDDTEHGGVTDEDIDAFFASHPGLRPINPLNGADPTLPVQFQSGSGRHAPPSGGLEGDEGTQPTAVPSDPAHTGEPPVVELEEEGGGGPDNAPSPPSPTPPATPPPTPEPTVEFLEIDGVQVPASQVRALLDFQQNYQSDPQLRALLTDHFVGRSAPVEGGAPATPPAGVQPSPAGGQPLTPPEDLDMEDPSVRALWAIVEQQNQQLNQLSSGVQTTYEAHMATQRASAQASYTQAAESFRTAHELDQTDVDSLAQVASRLGVLPSLMQGVDPLTGMPVRPDPVSAMNRALEIAYFMVPEYRAREFQRSVKQQQGDAERKKKLGAVVGSPGSATRTTQAPRPGTPEARAAMVEEVGQMMTGEWTGDRDN